MFTPTDSTTPKPGKPGETIRGKTRTDTAPLSVRTLTPSRWWQPNNARTPALTYPEPMTDTDTYPE